MNLSIVDGELVKDIFSRGVFVREEPVELSEVEQFLLNQILELKGRLDLLTTPDVAPR